MPIPPIRLIIETEPIMLDIDGENSSTKLPCVYSSTLMGPYKVDNITF
jgi:hypothetical protein